MVAQVSLVLSSSPNPKGAKQESRQKLKDSLQVCTVSTSINMVRYSLKLTLTGNLIEGCKTAGPHFNPHGVVHGGPDTEVRHVGDLGNVEANADGVANLDYEDRMVMLHGEETVIGRSCVCHGKTDDLGKGGDEESTKTGNAGARVACGVIGLSGAF